MRPLELRLSGFRSYRTERVVSFRDLDLLAIIGDTGAGKSSLLEAITWALYGASTWSKKASTELVAHGAKRMSVALEFEAAGERWRVTRTFARSGGGGAELECLSNPAIAKVDGVRQVDPEVERVLGLSYDVFCSCVLLPQGKFERLLKATRGEKTDVLKSILRLEALADVREIAERYVARVADREREVMEARGRFRPDPAADVALAEARLAGLRPERDRLAAVAQQVLALDERGRRHATEAERAGSDAERLATRRAAPGPDLRTLAARAETLGAALETAHETAYAAAEERAAADDLHAAAIATGTDGATLGRLEARLATARAALARRAEALRRSASDAEALDAARTAATEADEALARATADLEEHDAAQRAAAERATAMAAARDTASAALDALRAATDAEAGGREALATAQADLAAAEDRLAEARDALVRARAAHDQAQSAREDVLRRETAAHVAADCAPGDPCPVCARDLPADFVAPAIPDLQAADTALGEAAAALSAATAADQAAALAAHRATDRRETARARLDELAGATRAAHETARKIPRVSDAADPLAMLEVVVAESGLVAKTAGAEAEMLTAARPDKDAARTRATGAAATAAEGVRSRERAIAERERDIAEIAREMDEAVAGLPDWCAVPAGAAALDEAALDAADAAVATRLADAAALDRRRSAAAAAADAATARVHEAELAIERDVRRPTTAARTALWSLAGELPADVRADLAEPPADVAPATLAAFADDVIGRVDDRIAALRAEVEAATRAGAEAAGEAERLVVEAGYANPGALADRLDDLRAGVLAAEREHAAAGAQVEGAARLDALVARAREMRQGFEALKDALADKAFVGFVVARRQRALLAHASRTLEEITGRYAFTEDFRILDNESGLPRSADTLSGGETFLASLALALGLVEVADRSGGDLRALFLDEGFGSLDAAILDTALGVLEERAKAGRLIGLISHVPAVAEGIDTVLEIRAGVEGSSVHRLSGGERDERVTDGFVGITAGV
jgi:DNA repair protein SbcC/Rad50